MGSLWLDVRYALRMMMKTPALTAILAITLSLGIAASTTIAGAHGGSLALRNRKHGRGAEAVITLPAAGS